MTPTLTFFENIKLYVGFTDASSAALRELHPIAQPFFVPIVDDFYAAIEAHPGARRAITGGAAQIERLKQTLIQWIDKMLLGPHDEAYYERAHASAGCTSASRCRRRTCSRRWTGFASACSTSSGQGRDEPTMPRGSRRRCNQILDLELAIMLETYREDLEAKTATPSGWPRSASSPPASATSCEIRSASSNRRSISCASTSARRRRQAPASRSTSIGSAARFSAPTRTIHDLLDLARNRPPRRRPDGAARAGRERRRGRAASGGDHARRGDPRRSARRRSIPTRSGRS